MEPDRTKAYDLDRCIVEIYDQTETQVEDVALIRRLIAGCAGLRILEPFCGNGRILIPLAQDGHHVTGLDKAPPMVDSARARVDALPSEVRARIALREVDLLSAPWPTGFDLVILGGNCLYELATPEEQEATIRAAAGALRPGGYLYLDNDHMEGELAASWRAPGVQEGRFPTGRCADGTLVRGTTETIWYDAERRLVRLRRIVTIARPTGEVMRRAWVEQKHPPSAAEMRAWIEANGLVVEGLWGGRQGSPYTDFAPRAIFWAHKA